MSEDQVPRVRPMSTDGRPTYVVRLRRGGSPTKISAVAQRFDYVRGECAPTRFTRAIHGYRARRRTYRVVDVVDMWRIPLPWWNHGGVIAPVNVHRSEVLGSRDTVTGLSALTNVAPDPSSLVPVSRIVWRVTAQELHLTGTRKSLPPFLCDIARDPDDQWLFLRAYY